MTTSAPAARTSNLTDATRAAFTWACIVVIGVGAFAFPFWLPGGATSSAQAHAADAPIVTAVVASLVLVVIALELRRGVMTAATVALLAVLCATGAILRLFDLPGGGNMMFFLVVLAGAAFGARFGLLLGLTTMAVSAVVVGGVGPWLPFQMLAMSWLGACAGFLGDATRRLRPRVEVAVLAVYGWACGFVYGAIMNLWFWPFTRTPGSPISWDPDAGLSATLRSYWRFYVVTSFAWDAAGAFANALLILLLGIPLLRSMRRVAHRCAPAVEFAASPHDGSVGLVEPEPTPGPIVVPGVGTRHSVGTDK